MKSRTSFCLACMLACVLATAADATAQGRRGPGGTTGQANGQTGPRLPSDPFSGPLLTSAPFSADAVTTITQTLGDGTRIEQKTEAKFYRDSAGRVRREQTILGLNWANPAAQTRTVITIDPTPGERFAYTLDRDARTARRVPRAAGATGGVSWFTAAPDRVTVSSAIALRLTNGEVYLNGLPVAASVGAGQPEESLGTRQMEGLRVTGRKSTSVIAAGQIGNDRPIEVTDERWESPDLRMLIYSRFSDPRTGVVEFKLINITRAEPAADLFVVPPDYTIIEPGAGGRAGGPGARGPQ